MEENIGARNIAMKTRFIDGIDAVVEEIREGKFPGIESPELRYSFVTNFGLVKGKVQEIPHANSRITEDTFFSFMVRRAFQFRDQDVKESGIDGDFIPDNSSSGFVLRNVEITNFAHPKAPIFLEDFFIFSDQIVGVTLDSD